jgi:O-antigen/teichoic acid export membrane protein
MVAHSIDFNTGTLVIAAIGDNAAVGLYAAVSALMLKFLLFAQALQESLLPRIARDDAGRRGLVTQMSRIAVCGTLAAVLLFLAVARPVVTLLLSPAFMPGLVIAWWIAPGIVIHSASTVLMPFFEGTNRPSVVSVATWVGLLFNVVGVLFLYPRFGLAGAGAAMTLGLISRSVVLVYVFRRTTGSTLRELLVLRRSDWQFLLQVTRSLIGQVRTA